MRLWFFIFILALSCTYGESDERQPTPQSVIPDEIIFRGHLETARSIIIKQGLKIHSVDRLESNGDIYRLKLSGARSEARLKELSKQLVDTDMIEFAHPNRVIRLQQKLPKDAFIGQQWAVQNVGQDSPSGAQGIKGADIKLIRAWELAKLKETPKKPIIVGVIDTGIDYTHPDLAKNMWTNLEELNGIPGEDDDNNGYADDIHGWNFISSEQETPYHGSIGTPDPMDDNMHGTHCAGIIGAKGNNYDGIAGVYWDVKLMALKFLSKNGSGSGWDAARAVLYAVDKEVDILSNSWGGGGSDDIMQYVVEQANKAGILFVAAAGNEGKNIDIADSFPASYPVENVLSVAATDNKDQIASFSNYGEKNAHIAAPGVAIMSTIPVAKAPSPKLAYAALSGTSMATPYVAGAAALLIAAVPELRKNPTAIKARLMQTSDVKTALASLVQSQGRLNVARAIANEVNDIQKTDHVVSEPISIVSPAIATELFDHTWTVKRKGASRIRVHFASIMSDVPNFDLLAVYDGQYRRIYRAETRAPRGRWSPWAKGDTLHVRLANALVAMSKQVETPFDTPDDGFKAGASVCFPPVTPDATKVGCLIPTTGTPFANFTGQGFIIDSVEYNKSDANSVTIL